jgi:uncharacterized membrane protein
LEGLVEKEVALFSGDVASALCFRVLLLLDVLLLWSDSLFEEADFSADFAEDTRLLIFFLRPSS